MICSRSRARRGNREKTNWVFGFRRGLSDCILWLPVPPNGKLSEEPIPPPAPFAIDSANRRSRFRVPFVPKLSDASETGGALRARRQLFFFLFYSFFIIYPLLFIMCDQIRR